MNFVAALRWLARVWSIVTLLFVVLMVVGESNPNSSAPTAGEWVGLAFFPGGVVIGLLVAFRKEQLGGCICVSSLVAFYIWHVTVADKFPQGPWFLLLAAPGALFLICSRLRPADESMAPATSHPISDDGLPGNNLRVAIVVASTHHGNTRKVAQAMAEELRATVLTPEQVVAAGLTDYDLVGFGSGIYFGRHDGSLRRLVRSLEHVPPVAFIFSTAGLPFLARLFHWPLRRLLLQRGSRMVGEFSCRGWDTVGPLFLMGGLNRRHPNARDLAKATTFAAHIARPPIVAE